jgi:hypothetical protein
MGQLLSGPAYTLPAGGAAALVGVSGAQASAVALGMPGFPQLPQLLLQQAGPNAALGSREGGTRLAALPASRAAAEITPVGQVEDDEEPRPPATRRPPTSQHSHLRRTAIFPVRKDSRAVTSDTSSTAATLAVSPRAIPDPNFAAAAPSCTSTALTAQGMSHVGMSLGPWPPQVLGVVPSSRSQSPAQMQAPHSLQQHLYGAWPAQMVAATASAAVSTGAKLTGSLSLPATATPVGRLAASPGGSLPHALFPHTLPSTPQPAPAAPPSTLPWAAAGSVGAGAIGTPAGCGSPIRVVRAIPLITTASTPPGAKSTAGMAAPTPGATNEPPPTSSLIATLALELQQLQTRLKSSSSADPACAAVAGSSAARRAGSVAQHGVSGGASACSTAGPLPTAGSSAAWPLGTFSAATAAPKAPPPSHPLNMPQLAPAAPHAMGNPGPSPATGSLYASSPSHRQQQQQQAHQYPARHHPTLEELASSSRTRLLRPSSSRTSPASPLRPRGSSAPPYSSPGASCEGEVEVATPTPAPAPPNASQLCSGVITSRSVSPSRATISQAAVVTPHDNARSPAVGMTPGPDKSLGSSSIDVAVGDASDKADGALVPQKLPSFLARGLLADSWSIVPSTVTTAATAAGERGLRHSEASSVSRTIPQAEALGANAAASVAKSARPTSPNSSSSSGGVGDGGRSLALSPHGSAKFRATLRKPQHLLLPQYSSTGLLSSVPPQPPPERAARSPTGDSRSKDAAGPPPLPASPPSTVTLASGAQLQCLPWTWAAAGSALAASIAAAMEVQAHEEGGAGAFASTAVAAAQLEGAGKEREKPPAGEKVASAGAVNTGETLASSSAGGSRLRQASGGAREVAQSRRVLAMRLTSWPLQRLGPGDDWGDVTCGPASKALTEDHKPPQSGCMSGQGKRALAFRDDMSGQEDLLISQALHVQADVTAMSVLPGQTPDTPQPAAATGREPAVSLLPVSDAAGALLDDALAQIAQGQLGAAMASLQAAQQAAARSAAPLAQVKPSPP